MGIRYVAKDDNPPNLPMLRPIETFWSHLKSKVFANNWKAKNVEQMKERVKYCLKTFPTSYFEGLFKKTKTWIIRAEKKGIDILYRK